VLDLVLERVWKNYTQLTTVNVCDHLAWQGDLITSWLAKESPSAAFSSDHRNYVMCDIGGMFEEAGFKPELKLMSSVSKVLSFRKPE
jgi:hypothetical protein